MNYVVIFLVFLISACTITQNIEPAEMVSGSELCIIETPKVRDSFLIEYRQELTKKGIKSIVVQASDIPASCQWTSTYNALWSWDLSLYMSYAEIKIFNNGVLDGEAIYDSRKGGANTGKFIDAEEKITELVEQLIQFQSALFGFRIFG